MLASIPASMVNQKRPDLGIPNRIKLASSRFSGRRPILGNGAAPPANDGPNGLPGLCPASSQIVMAFPSRGCRFTACEKDAGLRYGTESR
jgi:hypothetical protein